MPNPSLPTWVDTEPLQMEPDASGDVEPVRASSWITTVALALISLALGLAMTGGLLLVLEWVALDPNG